MTTHLDPTAVNTRLELLLDEGEIKNCVLRYCHGTDRLNWQMVADCYLPSASDDHGSFQGGPAELAAWLASKSKNRGAKQHFVANQLVEINGDDAVCESYYFLLYRVHRRPRVRGQRGPHGSDPGWPLCRPADALPGRMAHR